MTRENFIKALQKCKKAKDFSCLGCLLEEVGGLRGGHPEGGRAFPNDTYYVTGNNGAHFYTPRSQRWIQRVLNASIKAARNEDAVSVQMEKK